MSEAEVVHTEESLLQLYRDLPPRTKHQDCPTPEHVAGYYINDKGSLAKAIPYLEAVLSCQFIDLNAFPGDREVLDILKAANTQTA